MAIVFLSWPEYHVQRRRRLQKGGSNSPLSIFRRELRDENLRALLGGSSLHISSSHTKSDPPQTSFIYNLPVADESWNAQPLSNLADNSVDRYDKLVPNSYSKYFLGWSIMFILFLDSCWWFRKCPLSDEDLREKGQMCEFVQGLVMSSFLDDLWAKICVGGEFGNGDQISGYKRGNGAKLFLPSIWYYMMYVRIKYESTSIYYVLCNDNMHLV